MAEVASVSKLMVKNIAVDIANRLGYKFETEEAFEEFVETVDRDHKNDFSGNYICHAFGGMYMASKAEVMILSGRSKEYSKLVEENKELKKKVADLETLKDNAPKILVNIGNMVDQEFNGDPAEFLRKIIHKLQEYHINIDELKENVYVL